MPYSFHKPSDFIDKESVFLIQVTSLPKEKYLKYIFYAQVRQIDGYPLSFRVKVNDFSRRDVQYRDIYLVKGRLTKFTFKKFCFYTLWLKKNAYLEKRSPNFIDNFIRNITYHIVLYFRKYLSDDAYGFLSAVFLGRRELAREQMKFVFRGAGIAHLFAISGLHVGLISSILFFILKIFRIKFRLRLLISIFFMFLYVLCTGGRPSIVRSALMFSFLGGSFFLKRRISLLDTLSTTGIVCLLLNPLWVFDLGFKFSFLAVFAILMGFSLFPLKSIGTKLFFVYIKGIFFSTLYVTIILLPLISFYFGKIYLLSIISNILLIPLFTFILIIGVIFLCFYFVPFLAEVLSEVVSVSVSFFMKLSFLLSSFRVSVIDIYFSEWLVFIYYIVIIGIVLCVFRERIRKFIVI